jgi:transcription antitermination factor NusG
MIPSRGCAAAPSAPAAPQPWIIPPPSPEGRDRRREPIDLEKRMVTGEMAANDLLRSDDIAPMPEAELSAVPREDELLTVARRLVRHPALRARRTVGEHWYALYTRSRHEKLVEALLRHQALETYLPLRRTWSRRRDRRLTVELPALPGYLFVRCDLRSEVRAQLKKTPGVVYLVENAGQPCVIAAREIESLRLVLAWSFNAETHPYFNVGDRVEVVRGPFVGAQGRLIRVAPGRHKLVVAIEFVSQAVAVEIDAADVDRRE